MMTKTGIDSPGPAAYSFPQTTAENVYISQGKRFTVSRFILVFVLALRNVFLNLFFAIKNFGMKFYDRFSVNNLQHLRV